MESDTVCRVRARVCCVDCGRWDESFIFISSLLRLLCILYNFNFEIVVSGDGDRDSFAPVERCDGTRFKWNTKNRSIIAVVRQLVCLTEWVCSRARACHTLHIMTGNVARRTAATFVNKSHPKMHVPFNIRLALVSAVIPTSYYDMPLRGRFMKLIIISLEKVARDGDEKVVKVIQNVVQTTAKRERFFCCRFYAEKNRIRKRWREEGK